MSLISRLNTRTEICELCSGSSELGAHCVAPYDDQTLDHNILICSLCSSHISNLSSSDENHWRCLNDAMWSSVAAVQVQSYQLLSKLTQFSWTADLLDMLYLDDERLNWAKSGLAHDALSDIAHLDCNGVVLSNGDSVTLVKDLNVKGAGFTAKRGTAVRNISVVHNNPNHIEGRVNDQRIVILTQYVKKN